MSGLDGTCVVVGASHAGAQLAISLRREGWTGPIQLIGEEPQLPYQRPPLSKSALQGVDSGPTPIYSPAVYEKSGISLMPGTRVREIDRAQQRVVLDDGRRLVYDKLALCTGARVRRLQLPGHALAGVHYLRTAADVLGIRAQARAGRHVVIVGGGYIGLEAAAALRQAGMQVTLLVQGARVLERVSAPEVSAYFARLHAAHGVDIRPHVRPVELRGGRQVEQVLCSDGRFLAADLVLVGIGVQPNLELARDAGLAVGDGILVDECARTSDPNIVAAGDCAFHPNERLGYSLRLESVPNATEQARSAAASLCGLHKPYSALPWFWSDQYDCRLQIAGLNRGYQRVVVQDDAPGWARVVWYIKDERILAADCINHPKQFIRAKKLLAEGASAQALTEIS